MKKNINNPNYFVKRKLLPTAAGGKHGGAARTGMHSPNLAREMSSAPTWRSPDSTAGAACSNPWHEKFHPKKKTNGTDFSPGLHPENAGVQCKCM